MLRTAFVVVVAMACAQARPHLEPLVVPVVPDASGVSSSNILKSDTTDPHGGRSTTVQQQSSTGGQASNGGFNSGIASSDTQSLNTPHGSSTSSNTDAKSVQGSNPAFPVIGGAAHLPVLPAIPVGFGAGSASGNSNSGIKQAETVNPFGGKSTSVHQQSVTGGQASNGGFNSGTASSDTQSQNTPHGSSTSSNTDAKSVQGSNPVFGAFPSFGGAPNLPVFPSFPGFGSGSAKGQAGSNILKSDTVGPHGGKSTTTQQQSSTGGQASNGGFNSGIASSDTQSQDTLHGSSTSSNTDAKSPCLPRYRWRPTSACLPSHPRWIRGRQRVWQLQQWHQTGRDRQPFRWQVHRCPDGVQHWWPGQTPSRCRDPTLSSVPSLVSVAPLICQSSHPSLASAPAAPQATPTVD